tara:strand:+ start:13881 stop:14687 length:807 start_codon:yes stop_codon:yes gene_type:complete
MYYLRLKFDNDESIDIYPYEDELSQRWFNEVRKNINNIWERDRIYGLNSKITYNSVYEKLRKSVGIIKFYEDLPDTEDLNELHTHFERMMEPEFFNKAPRLIQDHIIKYNVNIHHLESINSKRIVCSFKNPNKFLLEESDQKRFNFNQKPGTVCINYCHVGKPMYDIYHDNDSIAEKIVNQSEWSADFTIIYNHDKHKPFDLKAKKWCEYNKIKPRSWGLIDVGYSSSVPPKNIEYIESAEIMFDYEEDYAADWREWMNLPAMYGSDL